MAKHIADAEGFRVVNVNPDYCEVDGEVVPFDIVQVLSEEKAEYAPHFYARGKRVLRMGAIIRGVVGNAGRGVLSGVAEEEGDTVMVDGTENLHVGGKRVCRHGDECLMNVKA
jgi:hypothetical protein